LDELKMLKNKHEEGFVEAFDQELYPRIKFRLMDQIMATFAETLKSYQTMKAFNYDIRNIQT
jgi:hypothetical protein